MNFPLLLCCHYIMKLNDLITVVQDLNYMTEAEVRLWWVRILYLRNRSLSLLDLWSIGSSTWHGIGPPCNKHLQGMAPSLLSSFLNFLLSSFCALFSYILSSHLF